MNSAKLQKDVEVLKGEYSQIKDLYRAVCHLMFFRYGIQPSASLLYQFVRIGTMTLPTQAVNSFWEELRARHQVELVHTDLPDNLRVFAGEALSTLWKSALEIARQHYKESQSGLNTQEASHQLALESCKLQLQKSESMLAEQKLVVEALQAKISAHEKRVVIEQQETLAQGGKLVFLQNENDSLTLELKTLNQEFSAQLNKVHSSLKLSEDKFRKFEAKSLIDIERVQQKSLRLEIENASLKKTLLKEQAIIKAQNIKNQKLVNELRGNIGLVKLQLKESQRQQLLASNKLKQIDRKKGLIK